MTQPARTFVTAIAGKARIFKGAAGIFLKYDRPGGKDAPGKISKTDIGPAIFPDKVLIQAEFREFFKLLDNFVSDLKTVLMNMGTEEGKAGNTNFFDAFLQNPPQKTPPASVEQGSASGSNKADRQTVSGPDAQAGVGKVCKQAIPVTKSGEGGIQIGYGMDFGAVNLFERKKV